MEVINAIGRRKSAIVRVYLAESTGRVMINKKDIEAYFPSAILRCVVKQSLETLEVKRKHNIKANLDDGGFTDQNQTFRLAIAHAFVKLNTKNKKMLKDNGFLTRDSRAVECKKSGQPRARHRFQFSKR